jgi:Flp pilus assembly protein TadG
MIRFVDLDPRVREAATQRGQSLTELALTIPILMLLVVGAVDLGRVLYVQVSTAAAAQAGALYASKSKTTANDITEIRNRVKAEMPVVLTKFDANPTINKVLSGDNGDGFGRPYVQVTVSVAVAPIFRWTGMPTSYTVTRTATMRVVSDT